MSQSDLAERAGVSKQVISALVTKGSLEKASVATALGIAKALDMDINELVRRICGSSAK
jgi:transcriptional regulator with XRE-family HTH domain